MFATIGAKAKREHGQAGFITILTCCGRNLEASNQQSELLMTSVLDLDNGLGDLRKRTNATGQGETAQTLSGVKIRPRQIS